MHRWNYRKSEEPDKDLNKQRVIVALQNINSDFDMEITIRESLGL